MQIALDVVSRTMTKLKYRKRVKDCAVKYNKLVKLKLRRGEMLN